MAAKPTLEALQTRITALETELKAARAAAELGHKMRSLLHDLNNKLMALRGETYLALLDAPDPSPMHSHLERIQQTIESTIAITTSTREHLYKNTTPRPTTTPLSGCILVAEDDPMLREIMTLTLKPRGVEVLTAPDGPEAVEVYRKNWERIHLALIDLTMPGLNGFQTFDELKKINPSVKALLTSGFLEDDIERKISETGMLGFVPKPCDLDVLIRTLQTHLPQKDG